VGGSVVDHPEHPLGGPVGLLGHHLLDEGFESGDAGGVLAAAEDLRPMHVVGGEVGDRAAPVVVVVHPHRPGTARWQARVAAAPGLDRGFLIRGDHELVVA